MRHSNLIHIDLETTGLYARECGITQIAYILERAEPGEAEGKVLLERNMRVKIFPGTKVEPKALEVTGLSLEDLERGMEPREALETLLDDLKTYFEGERAIIVGYNVGFDEGFLRAFFKKCSGPAFWKYFQTPVIDVMSLAGNQCRFVRDEIDAYAKAHNMKGSFTLKIVTGALGLTPDGDLHDALVDIRITRQLYNLLNKEISWLNEDSCENKEAGPNA